MARLRVLAGILVGLFAAAPGAAQNDRRPDCVHYLPASFVLPNGLPFDEYRAVALFRFNRQKEALRELDAARAMVRGPWRWRLAPDQRKQIVSSLDALRNCLARTKPPQLARLTVRVSGDASDTATHIGPQPGARVYVEGIAVGRTDRHGRLTARVPSGPVRVEAEVPISHWSEAGISLAPGRSGSLDITLSDGKEVSERTKLVLSEAADDIIALASKSLTLKFMRGGRLAPVKSIDEIEAVDPRNHGFRISLTEYFSIVRGEIVATSAAQVLNALTPHFDRTIGLQAQAMASDREVHYGTIAFRVGQSPLSVTLASPPSNPVLPLSTVEVGVSLVGAGIAVQRVSDANGRFQVDSFPHGTVALDCVVVSNGTYYYGRATLAHSGPRSVTLVLRHVDDLKNGVPPLRVDGR